MTQSFDPVRYSVIIEKNPREIVMLRGLGCGWRRCRFCDYHLDSDSSAERNFALNRPVLDTVTGVYSHLEVINSGSFTEIDKQTMDYIIDVCVKKGISLVHFECHWLYRAAIPATRERFAERGITLKIKIGVETFDVQFREQVLDKGLDEEDPAEIARQFDECCLLQGLQGQSLEGMVNDIEIGLAHFERVCVNIMQENGCPVKPDARLIELFTDEIYPRYINNPRVDILMVNTEFGVGADKNA